MPLSLPLTHNTSFDWFSINLPLFLRDGFRFVFAYKKREPSYSRKPKTGWIPRNFLKNDKLFDLEMCNVKLKHTEINVINAICGNPTLPFKMEIRPVYDVRNVCKDTKKSGAAKLNCSMF